MHSTNVRSPDVEHGHAAESDPLVVDTATILKALDELPIYIVYLGIGFLLVFIGWMVYLLLAAMTWMIDILLGFSLPLSIGCNLIFHETLQHKIPPILNEMEQKYGDYILAGASLSTFMILLNQGTIFLWLNDDVSWFGIAILFSKSGLVFFILSRRFFQLVQSVKLRKKLPNIQLRHLYLVALIVTSLFAEAVSLPSIIIWYFLTSVAGAFFAILKGIDYCRRESYSTKDGTV